MTITVALKELHEVLTGAGLDDVREELAAELGLLRGPARRVLRVDPDGTRTVYLGATEQQFNLNDRFEAQAYEATRLAVNHFHAQIKTRRVVTDSFGFVRLRRNPDSILNVGPIDVNRAGHAAIQTAWEEEERQFSVGFDLGCWVFVCAQIGIDGDGLFANIDARLALSSPSIFATSANNPSENSNVIFLTVTGPIDILSGGQWEWSDGGMLQDGELTLILHEWVWLVGAIRERARLTWDSVVVETSETKTGRALSR